MLANNQTSQNVEFSKKKEDTLYTYELRMSVFVNYKLPNTSSNFK